MIELRTKLRKWGNSFGIVVPQKVLENSNITEGGEVIIFINKEKPNLKKLFGAHALSKPVKKLMKEMDEELYND